MDNALSFAALVISSISLVLASTALAMVLQLRRQKKGEPKLTVNTKDVVSTTAASEMRRALEEAREDANRPTEKIGYYGTNRDGVREFVDLSKYPPF